MSANVVPIMLYGPDAPPVAIVTMLVANPSDELELAPVLPPFSVSSPHAVKITPANNKLDNKDSFFFKIIHYLPLIKIIINYKNN